MQIFFGDTFEIIDIVEIDVVEQVPADAASSEFIRHPDAQKIDVFASAALRNPFVTK